MAAPVSTRLASTQAFQRTGTWGICIIIVFVHRNIPDKNAKVSQLTSIKNQPHQFFMVEGEIWNNESVTMYH